MKFAKDTKISHIEATGQRRFVIGDIHGCVQELEVMMKYLYTTQSLTKDDLVVFLGDYIDRGLFSKQVVDLLIAHKKEFPNTVFLKGNHEDMLLGFLGDDGQLGQLFLYNGGFETIQSYGKSVFASPYEIIDALPKDHIAFFQNLQSIAKVGNFLCVHAGLHPKKAFDAQQREDVFWIREEFLIARHKFKYPIVFGHTPHQDIFMHMPYKIGIDTGLVFGNKLSCIELTTHLAMQVFKGQKKVSTFKMNMNR